MPHETAAVSAHVLCTPYNHALCHSVQNHISKVYACLGVTCHLHFWQNDRDLLRVAAAVTRGWNGYRNKSQHRKLTLEKKIVPPLLQGFEPATFQSPFPRSNHRSFSVWFELLVTIVTVVFRLWYLIVGTRPFKFHFCTARRALFEIRALQILIIMTVVSQESAWYVDNRSIS